ncbi:MAG TPA: hypothetical protein VLL75_15165 [Vicinamibacteria bacterium]|nr:hypothetical protein [Vicinamibacteria bacterium]
MRTHGRTVWTAAAVAALALGLATGARAQAHAGHAAPSASAAKPAPLDDRVKAGIEEALQDEWHGQAIYERVLKDHGDVRPFSNIARAERRHAAFLADLLKGRGLGVPENRWVNEDVPGSASVKDACAAAVEFETKNVAIYDRLAAAGPLPDDVKSVFDHNRRASLEHHKPAFERCSGLGSARAGRAGRGCCGCGHGWRHGWSGCGQSCAGAECCGCAGGPTANEARPAEPGR